MKNKFVGILILCAGLVACQPDDKSSSANSENEKSTETSNTIVEEKRSASYGRASTNEEQVENARESYIIEFEYLIAEIDSLLADKDNLLEAEILQLESLKKDFQAELEVVKSITVDDWEAYDDRMEDWVKDRKNQFKRIKFTQ